MRWKDIVVCSLEDIENYKMTMKCGFCLSTAARAVILACFASLLRLKHCTRSAVLQQSKGQPSSRNTILAFLDDQNTSMSPYIARHVLRLSPNVDSNTNIFITPTLLYPCSYVVLYRSQVLRSSRCVHWRLATLAGVDVVDEESVGSSKSKIQATAAVEPRA